MDVLGAEGLAGLLGEVRRGVPPGNGLEDAEGDGVLALDRVCPREVLLLGLDEGELEELGILDGVVRVSARRRVESGKGRRERERDRGRGRGRGRDGEKERERESKHMAEQPKYREKAHNGRRGPARSPEEPALENELGRRRCLGGLAGSLRVLCRSCHLEHHVRDPGAVLEQSVRLDLGVVLQAGAHGETHVKPTRQTLYVTECTCTHERGVIGPATVARQLHEVLPG